MSEAPARDYRCRRCGAWLFSSDARSGRIEIACAACGQWNSVRLWDVHAGLRPTAPTRPVR